MEPTHAESVGAPHQTAAVTPTPPVVAAPPPAAAHPHQAYTQWVLLGSAAAAYLAFWWAGHLLSIPVHRGFEASLFRQPTVAGAFTATAAAAVLFVLIYAAAAVLTWRHWVFAGPLAASAGLAAWSFRGGPSRYVYLAPDNANVSTGVFWVLAAEMLFLAAVVAVGWLLILPWFDRPAAAVADPFRVAPPTRTPRPDGDVLQAVLTQAAFGALGVVLLVTTDEKKQAVFGVLTAFFIATALAQHFYHDERLARWYWVGPLLVGLVGYVVNGFGGDAAVAVETGRLTGTFAALARPLPLDYAGPGVVGSLLGYWIGSEHPDAAAAAGMARQPVAPAPGTAAALPGSNGPSVTPAVPPPRRA